jgi:hypothetical protein
VTEKPLELSGATLTFKKISVEAFFMGFPEEGAKARGLLPDLGRMLAAERIHQPISAIYTLDRIQDAAEHAARGGRILLDIAGAH